MFQEMTLEENILEVLHKAEQRIRANMEAAGENASHRTEKSLRVEQTQTDIALVIGGEHTAPLSTLEIGRPAGNVPGGFSSLIAKSGRFAGKPDVSNTFKAILIQWAKDKGISDFGWAQATGLGRQIAYEGTRRHSEPADVYSTVVNETIAELNNIIGLHVAGKIKEITQTNW